MLHVSLSNEAFREINNDDLLRSNYVQNSIKSKIQTKFKITNSFSTKMLVFEKNECFFWNECLWLNTIKTWHEIFVQDMS